MTREELIKILKKDRKDIDSTEVKYSRIYENLYFKKMLNNELLYLLEEDELDLIDLEETFKKDSDNYELILKEYLNFSLDDTLYEELILTVRDRFKYRLKEKLDNK